MLHHQVAFLGGTDSLSSELSDELDRQGIRTFCVDPRVQDLDSRALSSVAVVLIGPKITQEARLTLCRRVRALTSAPITVISDSLSELDELRLVAGGVCSMSYLPIRPRVLAAQIGLRLDHAPADESKPWLAHGNIEMQIAEHRVLVAGQALEITKTEFDLLAHLMTDPSRAFTYEELSRWIWNDPWMSDHHRLEAHACRLRKKITAAGGPSIISSVRGVGYRLTASQTADQPPRAVV
jgi:DNA-binding response OmpR family regulator